MRLLQDYNELRRNSDPALNSCIFSVLSENDRQKIAREVRFFLCRDEATIFHQGDQVCGVYILCRGRTKLIFRTQDGMRVLVRFCRPGEILNGIALQEYAFSAVAVGTSTVGFIDEAQAAVLIERYPKLGSEIERRFARDGQLLLERMAELAYESVEDRLAHVLLSLGRRHGVHEEDGLQIDLPLSQQDLADMIGASRQAVNHELRKLADRGLIHAERCQITILDEPWLQRLR